MTFPSRFWKPFLGVVFVTIGAGLLTSCDDSSPSPADGIENLPPDTGGVQSAFTLGTNASPYGYYLYTPSGYTTDGPKFPLLIFLHGSGEKGNSMISPAELDRVLVHGPPKLIKNKTWAPGVPMVVASIQCHDGWWDLSKVKAFTEFMMSNYQVDTTRIYMTGLSMGGYGTWDQLTILGKRSHITAAVPICGAGTINDGNVKRASELPVWAFHGNDDGTVSPAFDKAIWKSINDLHPAVAERLTIYPATGHDSWTKTYDGSGMGTGDTNFDAFDKDIYSWMLQYKKE